MTLRRIGGRLVAGPGMDLHTRIMTRLVGAGRAVHSGGARSLLYSEIVITTYFVVSRDPLIRFPS